jgi:3-dehydroquinate synthase
LGDNDAYPGSIMKKISIERVLEAALRVKKAVVEEDEHEAGIRRILNYGHTKGHGVESDTGMLHGWCVAVGMIPMCSPEARDRLVQVLGRLGFPLGIDCDQEAVFGSMIHDKKMENGEINAVFVEEPGTAVIKRMTPEELRGRLHYITGDRDEIRTDREETGT